jgi:hypothetical protein
LSVERRRNGACAVRFLTAATVAALCALTAAAGAHEEQAERGTAHTSLVPAPGWLVTGPADAAYVYKVGGRVRYPLTHLFDGDPKTAWVYETTRVRPASDRQVPYLRVQAPAPVRADWVRVMGGYNKDAATFARNSRPAEVTVVLDGKPVKTAGLADRTGWQDVPLPAGAPPFRTLELRFAKVTRGAEDDFCVSEMALLRGGRPVLPALPRAALLNNGLPDLPVGDWLIDRGGRVLAEITLEGGGVEEWSADGRYIAGSDDAGVWVCNTAAGRIVLRTPVPKDSLEAAKWQGAGTLALTLNRGGTKTTRTVRVP